MDSRIEAQREMLKNRVLKNLRRLKSYLRSNNIQTYRIFDRDIPELPLAIDWYDGRLHVSEYKVDPALPGRHGEEWVQQILGSLVEKLGVEQSNVFIKSRFQAKGKSQYQKLGNQKVLFDVSEYGVKCLVNLKDYLDTGLFLDHRPLRKKIQDTCKGKSLLNLFCYTGAFTLHAQKGGASKTVSVDLSKTYLDWLSSNMSLNGFEENRRHALVRDDVMNHLNVLTQKKSLFDIIVIDPPTFSNSKKTDNDFEVQKDHEELLSKSINLLSKGGTLYFSTNKKKFSMSDSLQATFEEITDWTVPLDFSQRRPHRSWSHTS